YFKDYTKFKTNTMKTIKKVQDIISIRKEIEEKWDNVALLKGKEYASTLKEIQDRQEKELLKKKEEKFDIKTVKDLKEVLNKFDESLEIGFIGFDLSFVKIENIRLNNWENRNEEYYSHEIDFKENIVEIVVDILDL